MPFIHTGWQSPKNWQWFHITALRLWSPSCTQLDGWLAWRSEPKWMVIINLQRKLHFFVYGMDGINNKINVWKGNTFQKWCVKISGVPSVEWRWVGCFWETLQHHQTAVELRRVFRPGDGRIHFGIPFPSNPSRNRSFIQPSPGPKSKPDAVLDSPSHGFVMEAWRFVGRFPRWNPFVLAPGSGSWDCSLGGEGEMGGHFDGRKLKYELLNVWDEVLLILFEIGSSSCKINA